MKTPILTLFALLVAVPTVWSATERLNDQPSPRQVVEATAHWLGEQNTDKLTDEEFNTMVAEARGVEIRLVTARFVGQPARIFLRLPARIRGLRSPNAIRLEWKPQGIFAAGSVVAGNRAQIFEGPIPGPLMTDIFDFTMYIDSRDLVVPLSFDPIYEIDVD